jgi:hypothetical protein
MESIIESNKNSQYEFLSVKRFAAMTNSSLLTPELSDDTARTSKHGIIHLSDFMLHTNPDPRELHVSEVKKSRAIQVSHDQHADFQVEVMPL